MKKYLLILTLFLTMCLVGCKEKTVSVDASYEKLEDNSSLFKLSHHFLGLIL